jgi:hypothetical protein
MLARNYLNSFYDIFLKFWECGNLCLPFGGIFRKVGEVQPEGGIITEVDLDDGGRSFFVLVVLPGFMYFDYGIDQWWLAARR